MGKIVDGLLEEIKKLSANDKATLGRELSKIVGIKGSFSPGGGITDTGDILSERLRTRTELFKSQGVAAKEMVDIFSSVEEASRRLTGETQAGMAALNELGASMKSFAFLSNEARVSLIEGAITLEKFGVSAGTLGEIMDTATFSFGANQEQMTKLTNQLGEIVSKFPGQAQQIAENFRNAQQSLLYDSNKIIQVFGKLQKTSTMTGVSFDSLTNAFGNSMDTFQGSSEKAGRLNAILGKSVFNSIDLLGKTEAERVETIIAGVKKNVNVEALKQNKFQLQAVAAGLGLTPDETRRLLSGKATVEDVMKGKKDPRQAAQERMAEALDDNTMGLKELQNAYMAIGLTQMERFRIGFNTEASREITNQIKGFFDLAGDASIKNINDLIERTQSAAIASGAEGAKEMAKSLDELFNKFIAGGSTKEAFESLKGQFKDLGDRFKAEFKISESERMDRDLIAVKAGQKLVAFELGEQAAKAIISPIAKAINDFLGPASGAGAKTPNKETIDALSGLKPATEQLTAATNTLTAVFSNAEFKLTLDKGPAGSLLGTGTLTIDPKYQLQSKIQEAKRK